MCVREQVGNEFSFLQGYVPGAGRGMSGQYGNKVADEDKGGVQQDLTDSNYSEFFGYVVHTNAQLASVALQVQMRAHPSFDCRYQESLFSDANYDEDDKEADAIWEAVDET
jgi:pre-mRNA-processing factor 6